jgi:flagellar assembly factor FliW
MPSLDTKYFGVLTYREEAVFEFPQGLPAFEEEHRFVLIEMPENAPLVFLQSLRQPGLCFLAFPILVADREYRLAVSPEDREALQLDGGQQPKLGSEVLVLTLVSLHDGFSATANLMAPIVLNLKTHCGLQAIRQDNLYSHQHPIQSPSPEVVC